MRKKSVQIFFSASDEAHVSQELLSVLPNLKFIDGQRWPSSDPPLKGSIDQCTSFTCYLWDASVVHELPSLPLKQPYEDKLFQGPTSGLVMQYCRCIVRAGVLRKGDLGVGWDETNEPLDRVFKAIFKCFARFKGTKLRCITPQGEVLGRNIGGCLVGPDAKRFASTGGRFEASAGNYYEIEG